MLELDLQPERHSSGGNINGGWRCGSTTGLNGSASWERMIFQAD